MALRIALFGQSAFGKDVLDRILADGHQVAAVYAPPAGRRSDPLAEAAERRGLPLFRHERFRRKGGPIAGVVGQHSALDVELNVLAYVTAIMPLEILDGPSHRSICFHPSLLPRYRGGAAIPWQIILGAEEVGVTVFRPDDGIDSGPIVIQKGGVTIDSGDTAATLYFDKLYPLGIEAIAEAVALIDRDVAVYHPQDHELASYQGLIDDDGARVDWMRPISEISRRIRGCDPQPGALTYHDQDPVRCYGFRLEGGNPQEDPGTVIGRAEDRLLIAARDGALSVGRLRVGTGDKQLAAKAGFSPGDRFV